MFRLSHLIAIGSLVSVAFASVAPAQAPVGRQRGATLGGLAGAIAGGLIGDHNNEAGAGAAIGGVVGAVAGGIMGDAADKEHAYQQQQAAYYHAQRQQQYQQKQVIAAQSAVTMQDVITMTRSGLSDQVILNQVRQRGYLGKLAVSDIIALHEQGVSENVITSLQTVGTEPQPEVVVTSPAPTVVERHYHPRPVIIEEHVMPHYPPPHRYRAARHSFYYRF